MKKRMLGRTGVPVSELCFGTMNFGWTIDRGTAFDLMDAYRNAGGAFYQAVHLSPRSPFIPDTFSTPEEWLGEWMRERAIPRDELVLSTRLIPPGSLDSYSSTLKDILLKHCESSLGRIGITCLDLLVCEWSRELLPAENLMEALEGLVSAGYVRGIAFANLPLWRAMEMVGLCRDRESIRPAAIQTGFSRSLPEDVRSEVEAFCQTTRTGLLVTSALGRAQSGIKKNREESGSFGIQKTEEPATPEKETGYLSVVQRELSWVLDFPEVSSVVISTRSVSQLTELTEVTGMDSGDTGESDSGSTSGTLPGKTTLDK